jgi:hypothetical protein
VNPEKDINTEVTVLEEHFDIEEPTVEEELEALLDKLETASLKVELKTQTEGDS